MKKHLAFAMLFILFVFPIDSLTSEMSNRYCQQFLKSVFDDGRVLPHQEKHYEQCLERIREPHSSLALYYCSIAPNADSLKSCHNLAFVDKYDYDALRSCGVIAASQFTNRFEKLLECFDLIRRVEYSEEQKEDLLECQFTEKFVLGIGFEPRSPDEILACLREINPRKRDLILKLILELFR